MELKQVTRKSEPKTKRLNLKTTKTSSIWMKENNISPQLVFDLAIKELMDK